VAFRWSVSTPFHLLLTSDSNNGQYVSNVPTGLCESSSGESLGYLQWLPEESTGSHAVAWSIFRVGRMIETNRHKSFRRCKGHCKGKLTSHSPFTEVKTQIVPHTCYALIFQLADIGRLGCKATWTWTNFSEENPESVCCSETLVSTSENRRRWNWEEQHRHLQCRERL
jgi:hypothetical protein